MLVSRSSWFSEWRETTTNERSVYVSVKNEMVDWLSLYQLVIVVFTKLPSPILPSFACSFLFWFFFLLLGKFSYRTSKIDCTSLCREYWLSCFVGKILSKRCYRRYDDILENEISVIRKYMIRKFVSSVFLSNFANGYNFTTIACNLYRNNYGKYKIWNQF